MASDISSENAPPTFAAALRSDLLAGKYSRGEWLKQADLEETYNANRFEVRIALAELNVRGLLEHLPNRGYRVCIHTDKERENLYEVRTLWEVAACRLVVQRAKAEQILEFKNLVQQFDRAIESESQEKLRELNAELHQYLYLMTGNPLLADQIKNLRERGIPGRKGQWDTINAIRASSADHLEMLEMLQRRDADGLGAVVHRHLNHWRKFAKPLEAID